MSSRRPPDAGHCRQRACVHRAIAACRELLLLCHSCRKPFAASGCVGRAPQADAERLQSVPPSVGGTGREPWSSTIRVDTPSIDMFRNCVLHSRPHVDDVTLTSVILAAPAFGPPATLPACSKRCAQSTSTLALSSYRSATSRHDAPASIASITRSSKSLEYGLGIDRPLGIESMPLDSFVDKPSGIFPIQSERNTL
jgi:hypothetical protein